MVPDIGYGQEGKDKPKESKVKCHYRHYFSSKLFFEIVSLDKLSAVLTNGLETRDSRRDFRQVRKPAGH
jgi:hypothetical protein